MPLEKGEAESFTHLETHPNVETPQSSSCTQCAWSVCLTPSRGIVGVMGEFFLRQKLRELCQSGSTLLWLEGPNHQFVRSVKLHASKLVLAMRDDTHKVVTFEKYVHTDVGLQFWSNGRVGVLYRWDMLPTNGTSANGSNVLPLRKKAESEDPSSAA